MEALFQNGIVLGIIIIIGLVAKNYSHKEYKKLRDLHKELLKMDDIVYDTKESSPKTVRFLFKYTTRNARTYFS